MGKRGAKKGVPRAPGGYPLEMKLAVVREAMRGVATQPNIGKAYGVSAAAVSKWLRQFRQGGPDALKEAPRGARSWKRTPQEEARREAVVSARTEHPEWGTRRIAAVLARFEAIGVSETTVRRILHEEGLIPEVPEAKPAREHPPRRFERAEPNQLWQSDIFTFLLRRHERLYLTAFMDDHSRFLVSTALAHHQKSELVMEAVERGIATYGTPREILTDQGRQYRVWRGKTEFELALRRQGIEHITSRPQHPQTLGKIERFWKTLWEEFLSRTVFADFADCERRLGLYVQHYNFQRPHQALDGQVPADRYFRASAHVRAAVEQQVAANAQRLAMELPAQKPFYLVGRLGDRDLSIAATHGGLTVQMGDEEPQRITMPKESDHGTQAARRVTANASSGPTPLDASSTNAEVAEPDERPGRGGAPTVPAGAVGAGRRESGDGGDRRGADLAWDVLPAGDQGAERDAASAGPRQRWRERRWGDDDEQAHRGPRGAGEAARAGETTNRESPTPVASAGATRTGDNGAWASPQGASLEARWERTFAALAEEGDEERERAGLDPDLGWQRAAEQWPRKLVGDQAATEAPGHDAAQAFGLRASPERAHGAGATVPAGPGRSHGSVDSRRRGAAAGDVAESLPDHHAPWRPSDARGDSATAGWPPAEGGARSGAGTSGPGAGEAELEPTQRPGDDDETLFGGERGAQGSHETESDEGDEEGRGP